MMETSTITFKGLDNQTNMESIEERLNNLMLCAEGTLPGSRSFGLRDEFISLQSPQAINLFAVELQEKADIYVPEVIIKNVRGIADSNGNVIMSIELEGKE